MTRALLGLGSNLGDRVARLRAALAGMPDLVAVSDVYETEPLGGPGDQSRHLNMVVQLDTDLGPRALLELCRRLEQAAGRVRGERWGPRSLDVDVLWIDGTAVNEPDLVVPHPRMRARRFVMAPLAELAADVAGEWEADAVGEVRHLGPLDQLDADELPPIA